MKGSRKTNCQVYVSTCEFIIKIFFKITLVEFYQIESDSQFYLMQIK